MNRLLPVLPGVLPGAVLGATLLAGPLAAPSLHAQGGKTETAVGPADFDWPLLTLTGERTSLDAFRGKVLVINHWATWCLPCLEELPSLAALRDAVPDRRVAFLLVSPQDRRRVTEFVRRRRIALPVYLEAEAAPSAFGLEAVPTTWVVDHTGDIVLKRRGAMRWDTPELIALLRSLAVAADAASTDAASTDAASAQPSPSVASVPGAP